MIIPDSRHGMKRKELLALVRERLEGLELRQLIREEIRRRKRGRTPVILESDRQLRMYTE